MELGSGAYRYRVVENWAQLPEGWEFKDVGAVAVDSKDRVYVFNRGEHPMMVFDREGNFLAFRGANSPRLTGDSPRSFSTLLTAASVTLRGDATSMPSGSPFRAKSRTRPASAARERCVLRPARPGK